MQFYGTVIIVSATEFGPEGVDENLCTAVTYFFYQSLYLGTVIVEYQFKSLRFHVFQVSVDGSFRTFFMQLDHGHEDHFIQHFSVFGFHPFVGQAGFHDTLVYRTCLFEYLVRILEVIIAFVYIHHDFAFAQIHDFFKSRYLMPGFNPGTVS